MNQSDQPDYVACLRNKMLNDVILALAIIAFPMMILSLSRAETIGWRSVFSLHLVAVSSIWIFWSLRSRIGYKWRVGILLFILATVGFGGYLDFGPAAIAGQFLLLYLVVGALFLDSKHAIYTGAVVVVLLAVMAVVVAFGKIVITLDYRSYANHPATWAILFLAVAGFGGTISMITGRLINEVQSSHEVLAKANYELRLSRDTAESANRLKSEILANLSHEFRTPMNGIIGMADLLRLCDEDPERQGYIRDLQASAHRLSALLERMLDFAHLGDGHVNFEDHPFDLCELASQSIKYIRGAAGAKGIEVRFDCDPGSVKLVIGDGRRMQQVLGELLCNALSFTRAGEISLRVRCADTMIDDDRLWIVIDVSDTGIGISPEKHESIFQPLFQVDGSITRSVGGNGLGLAICKRVVHLMGGNLTISSEVGVGSTFTVNLPFRQ